MIGRDRQNERKKTKTERDTERVRQRETEKGCVCNMKSYSIKKRMFTKYRRLWLL